MDRLGGGPYDSFSLGTADLAALCQGVKSDWFKLWRVGYSRKSSERGNVKFHRSFYFMKDMMAGDVIAQNCVLSECPGFGLTPRYFEKLIGRKVHSDVYFSAPVRWDFVELGE